MSNGRGTAAKIASCDCASVGSNGKGGEAGKINADLLTALKGLVGRYQYLANAGGDIGPLLNLGANGDISKARAAIARATGKEERSRH